MWDSKQMALVACTMLGVVFYSYEQRSNGGPPPLSLPPHTVTSSQTSPSPTPTNSAPPTVPPSPSPTPSVSSSATPTPTPTPTPVPTASSGQYKNGTYTGSSVFVLYGNVQVQVSIQNGKIAQVQVLQYPNSHQYSVYVSQQAIPYLQQESIQAQNAQISIVSGATATSEGFIQSLSNALGQA